MKWEEELEWEWEPELELELEPVWLSGLTVYT